MNELSLSVPMIGIPCNKLCGVIDYENITSFSNLDFPIQSNESWQEVLSCLFFFNCLDETGGGEDCVGAGAGNYKVNRARLQPLINKVSRDDLSTFTFARKGVFGKKGKLR